MKIIKLQNTELENVVAGVSEETVKSIGEGVIIGCSAAAAAGAISSLGCQIASTVYSAKANKASERGDIVEAARLRRISHNTGIAAASLGGAAFVATGVGVGVGLSTGGFDKLRYDSGDFLMNLGVDKPLFGN